MSRVPVHSVIQDWVFTLPYRMQSVLMCSLRGCDGARKEDASKHITRGLRFLVLNQADPSNSFMKQTTDQNMYLFIRDLDHYPLHFVTHTMHAIEIVGYKHPDRDVRGWWLMFYRTLVKELHLNYESERQLDVRLGHTQAEVDHAESKLVPIPDAGTGTSTGKKGYV